MKFEWPDIVLGLPLGLGLAVLHTLFWWWMYPELPENPDKLVVVFIALINFVLMNIGLGLAAGYREWRKNGR